MVLWSSVNVNLLTSETSMNLKANTAVLLYWSSLYTSVSMAPCEGVKLCTH